MTERECYDLIDDELKADLRTVISDPSKLMEVAQKHNLTFKERGREYAKASVIHMITVIRKFEG